MNHIRTIFFGSTQDSILVLNALHNLQLTTYNIQLVCIVTQPPRPIGRKKTFISTPVEIWAKKQNIPVLSFQTNQEKPWLYENETQVIDSLQPFKADLIVTADYGQKIPWSLIERTSCKGLNVHPSLLPRWRGGDPVPWTMLVDDQQTGVTVVTLEKEFDKGKIIVQQKIPVEPNVLPDALRTHLFELGANLLVETLPGYLSGRNKGTTQDPKKATYARRLKREDGFVPWELIQAAMEGKVFDKLTLRQAQGKQYDRVTIVKAVAEHSQIQEYNFAKIIERALRAFSPWPGIWTKVKVSSVRDHVSGITKEQNYVEKRLKITKVHLADAKLILDEVQLEGKNPVSFKQFQEAYLT